MLDTHALPIELQLAHERFERIEGRTAKNFDAGDTHGALAVSQEVLPRLADAIKGAAESFDDRGADITSADISRLVGALDPDIISLCVLQSCMSAITGDKFTILNASMRIGKAVNGELWADALNNFAQTNADNETDKLRKKAASLLPARIEAAVRRKHGSLKQRLVAARSIARRAGFEWKGSWTPQQTYRVGLWLLNVTLEALPDVFTTAEVKVTKFVGGKQLVCDEYHLVVTEGAQEVARASCQAMVCSNPFYLPDAQPPLPWTDWNKGGPIDPRVRATLVRSRHRETAALVRDAIASGQMQPALDAINTIQATPWKINAQVLGVMKQCIARGIEVEGLPSGVNIPAVEHGEWDEMSEQEQMLWKIKTSEIKAANRALVGDRLSLVEDMTVAEQLVDLPAFWTAYNMDWRGRVYALPHFNFQRSDRVRGLFLFAHGMEIGEEGIEWLKIHLANCGDFEKTSKAPFEARVSWVNSNLSSITQAAEFPLSPEALSFWTAADQPFLFLAACFELTRALAVGPTHVSSLPVSWDGSCSGLQHLCAMTRAEEGYLVNLTDSDKPQDVYQYVAEQSVLTIAADAGRGDEVAKRAMLFGVNRTMFKRNVMTYCYSSKKSGMALQQDEDLMERLRLDVLKGKYEEHPFGEQGIKRNKQVPSYAARYLAKVAYETITSVVKKPTEAMNYLQSITRALAHEGKPLSWTTPTGLPWVNRYHVLDTKRVRLYLHDRGVKRLYTALLTVGDQKLIDKDRAANGVAPNFVHALDAAHLALTVNAGEREGMGYFALVHDSFGCHAAWAGRFHQIIREQFVEMYETHDVLSEVLETAKCVLSEPNLRRLPDQVDRGPLNIRGVLHARYAFA